MSAATRDSRSRSPCPRSAKTAIEPISSAVTMQRTLAFSLAGEERTMRILAASLVALAVQPFYSSIRPLPAPVLSEVRARAWHPGCPLPLSDLRLLIVAHWGFDNRVHAGQLVVNANAAEPLTKVFRQLYKLHFQIHHMR